MGNDGSAWFGVVFFVIWGSLMVVSVASYGFGIWALVDICRYRDDEFAAVGLTRTTWLVLQIIGLAACQPMGLVVAGIFLISHRPKLKRWRDENPWAPVPVYWYPGHGYGPAPGAPPLANPPFPPPSSPSTGEPPSVSPAPPDGASDPSR